MKGFIDATTGEQLKGTSSSPNFPIGDFPTLIENPIATVQTWAKGKVSFWWLAGIPFFHINDPELAEEVLKHDTNFSREIPLYIIGRLVGKGIIASHGDAWARHHRILYKAFVPKVITTVFFD